MSAIDVYRTVYSGATLVAAKVLEKSASSEVATGVFEVMRAYNDAALISERLLHAKSAKDRTAHTVSEYREGYLDANEACDRLSKTLEGLAELATVLNAGIHAEGSEQLKREGTNVSRTIDLEELKRLTELLTKATHVSRRLIIESK